MSASHSVLAILFGVRNILMEMYLLGQEMQEIVSQIISQLNLCLDIYTKSF